MSQVMKMSTKHADNLQMMDVGLRNQRSEIESSHQHMQAHALRMGSHEQQILHFAAEAEQRMAEHATFEARCKASVASLRSECDNNVAVSASLQDRVLKMNAGLQNQEEVIRGMRCNYVASHSTNMATDERI